jgi:hypothetical protein
MYASKSTRGFYDTEIHGSRLTTIQDPAWVRPTTDIVVQPGESVWVGDELLNNTGDEPITLRAVPDMRATPDTLEVVNPACLIPEDAVEITAAYHAELLAGQSAGQVITWGEDGYPVLMDPPVVWLAGAELAEQVDTTIAGIYLNWTRFQAEYEFREKAARAYQAADYTGECGVWISAFAVAAGLTSRAACDLILLQSDGLRAAQESLGALRMRKYELLPLAEQAALDRYDEINAAIQQAVALIA